MSRSVIRELEAGLHELDAATRADRVRRLGELASLGEPDGRMLWGDCLAALCEAQLAYVQGLFLSTILAAQVCVEQLLTGFLDTTGLIGKDNAYPSLLATALSTGLITPGEHEALDMLRRLRNPHAHYRSVTRRDRLFWRAQAQSAREEDLLATDAQHAIRTLVQLVNRPPFSLGPTRSPFSEHHEPSVINPAQLSIACLASSPGTGALVTRSLRHSAISAKT